MAEARTQVTFNRITGKIAEWKGKFGFIVPDVPVVHQAASKNGGRIFLSVQDVEEAIEGIGSPVSFTVYADSSGLGAARVRPAESGAKIAPAVSHPLQAAAKVASVAAKVTEKVTGVGKAAVNLAISTPKANQPSLAAKAAAAKAAATPPRKRVSYKKLKGEVTRWGGKFGFVRIEDEFSHPKLPAAKTIYMSALDLVDMESVKLGQKVSFFVFEDSEGLGAESVTAVGATSSVTLGSAPKISGAAAAKPAVAKPAIAKPAGLLPAAPKLSAAKIATPKPTAAPKLGASVIRTIASKPIISASTNALVVGLKAGVGGPSGVLRPLAQAQPPAEKPSPKLPRERISEIQTTGEILKWSGAYGWVKMHQPIVHEKARPDGTVFVSISDMAPHTATKPGTLLQFHVFVDSSGLGAEDVSEF